ncbi:MAG: hypothetical protein ACI9OW_000202 [Marinobacter psychrophilus]|jgi:hypothetical protein
MAKTAAFAAASRLFLPELRVEGGALYEVEPASESRPQYHARLYTVEYRNKVSLGPVVMRRALIDKRKAIKKNKDESGTVNRGPRC